ncbi:unnamed protein product [Sphenostylis stenocarpa]|uniref:Protein kinase domain-containing protein n=1 Tax=Sphenostylis stenocarpa TaxID=92480 RepID=A0AA86VGU5_9FABA|nr:unnamed protein product [Sphenostylis stenocarpa]
MRLRCDLFECCFTSTSSDTFPKHSKSKWRIFSYKELAKATNYFEQSHCLRKGIEKRGFTTQYYGTLEDGREITVQCFKEDKRYILQQFINETVILNYLPHKNIVSIYGCSSHHEEPLLVQEYLSNGNLAAHFQSNISLPWHKRLDIAIDIANALDYLHYYGIIHRNVKSSNILLHENFSAKVGSLHLSRKLPDGVPVDATHLTSDRVGSSGYIDPEYLTKGQLSVKNDVYSFGVVLCELLSSQLAKNWVLNEEENLATLLSRKLENQSLVELLDPRLGFQSNLMIKQVMTATAELAVLCMKCPQESRPNMEQVLEILYQMKQGRYKINSFCTKALKIFHHADLEEATNNFGTCLGEGGYGSVYYGKLKDGLEVAIKRFHDENETEETINQFMKESEILGLLHHQNLVSLYGRTSRHSNKHMLVYEYISNGTLSKHLHESSSKLPWHTRLNIAIETATALVYLHDSGIIHRDVKGSNILLDENFIVKVADFGFSRSLPDHVTHVTTIPVGTRAYIDPDYYLSGRVSNKSDVYSFGVVLFELISSIRPSLVAGTDNTLAQFAKDKILNSELKEIVDPSFWRGSDKNIVKMVTAVAELAFQCVQCPKELRPSMKQVLETLEGIRKGKWGFNQIT